MKKRYNWIFLYTAMFLAASAGIIIVCALNGRALIYAGDGYQEEYTVMLYIKRWLSRVFSGQGVKLIDFTLGQGLDVPSTLTFYGFTDPVVWFFGLFPDSVMETAYALAGFTRIYIAGLLLGLYIGIMGVQDLRAKASGCMIYAFSLFNIVYLGRFTYFINGGLYFILLLISIERLIRQRKWLLYVLSAALGIWVNFYFAFINTICAIVYISIRLTHELRHAGFSHAAKSGSMLLGGYILGMMLAAPILLPVAKLYLSNGRMGVASGYSKSFIHYPYRYYLKLIGSMFASHETAGFTAFLGYAAPSAALITSVLFSKRRNILTAPVLCCAGLCIPAFGYFMNGGSYTCNRWGYVLSVFMGLTSAIGFDYVCEKRRVIAVINTIITFAAAAASLFLGWALYPCVLMLAVSMILVFTSDNTLKWLLTALVFVSCTVTGIVWYMPEGGGAADNLMNKDVYQYLLDDTPARLIDDASLFRTDTQTSCDPHSSTFGYMGTGYYWSLIDANTTSYAAALGSIGQRPLYRMYGVSSNAFMAAVAGVKYHITPGNESFTVPYGYTLKDTLDRSDGGSWLVYENDHALPLGYAYSKTLSYDVWKSLPVWDRISALTAYAITEDGDEEFTPTAFELPITHMDFADGLINAKQNIPVGISFEPVDDAQIFLVFEGFRYDPADKSDNGPLINLSCNGSKLITAITHPSFSFYFPNETLAFYLGHGSDIDSCTITCGADMLIDYTDVRVYAVPDTAYISDILRLQSSGMTETQTGLNSFSGNITLEGDSVLQIALPYSDGWKASVDGEETELFVCGGMYMGLHLTGGFHHIKLEYFTPWLKEGLLFNLSAAALLAVILLTGYMKFKKQTMVCK